MAGGRHHVVSRGYQRHWTDDGVHIRLVRKADLWSKQVSTKHAFVEAGFNAVRTDEGVNEHLEREWSRVESVAIPIARHVITGQIDASDPSIALAIKSLVAVHWARSYSLQALIKDAYAAGRVQAIREWPELPRMQAAYRKQYGRDPYPGEIAAAAERIFRQRVESNEWVVDRMVSLYNQVVEKFGPLNVEIARVAGRAHELITGDSPVVMSDGIRVGQSSGLGVMQSSLVYMPLHPGVAVSLIVDEPRQVDMYPLEVQKANRLVWRSSRAFVAARPSANWRRSLMLPSS